MEFVLNPKQNKYQRAHIWLESFSILAKLDLHCCQSILKKLDKVNLKKAAVHLIIKGVQTCKKVRSYTKFLFKDSLSNDFFDERY